VFGGAIRITVPNIVKIVFLLSRYCNFSNFQNGMSVPNFVKIGQSVAKILRLFDFTRWRLPPSWVFKFLKCYWLTVSEGHKHITVPNFVTIVVPLQRYCDFSNFQDGRRRHLGFFKSRNFIGY